MKVIPAILESFRTLKDKTFKVTFETNELSPELVSELSQNLQQFGYLAFKKEDFTSQEIGIMNNLKTDFDDVGKSPSQRLRAVLYVMWKRNNERYELFTDFYTAKIEKVINHYKTKLNDE